MMIPQKAMLEKILDSKASSYLGSALMLPLLALVILTGSINYKIGRETAPIIEKILTPPVVEKMETVEFKDVLVSQDHFQSTIEAFETNEVELIEMPKAIEDAPQSQPKIEPVATEVALSETPNVTAAIQPGNNQIDLPGVTIAEISTQAPKLKKTNDLIATMHSAVGRRATKRTSSGNSQALTGGVVLGKDKSGDISSDESIQQAVAINRSQVGSNSEVGMSQPASQEKVNLTGWILGHPRSLPPAVSEALGFSRQKADHTSGGSAVDETGKLYEFFFLHRAQNNLLRILVVLGNQAYRIDLPDFYLEANHVRTGRVFRGPPPQDDPFAPGGIIEVALESVSEIPKEIPEMFQLVLNWLEIKEQES